MIQENPALTQEQFKAGGIVEPGVMNYGTTTEEGSYIFKRKGKHAKKTYYHLRIEDRSGGKTKEIINEMLEATPANLKKLQKQRDQIVKKRWPDRISDEEFRKLRTSDKYKNLNNEDFAKVLDKKGYKTKFGSNWGWNNVQAKQRDLNLLGEVGYKPRRLTPEKEVLDLMKTIKEGPERVEAYIKAGRPKKMLENFRARVAQKVYYEKYGPDLSRALEWRLKNPEKVKELSMKRFAETGLFPSGKTHKEHLWRDLWRSSQTKVGDRFKFISELPPYKINDRGNKIRNWLKDDHYKKIKFKDTKTGKTITFNNLQKYLDETIGKGTYDKSISGYELKDTLKNQKITYKGKTGTVGGLLKQNLYSPEQLAKQKLLSPFHMQHPGGVAKNWWTNEVVFSDANQKLRDLDSSLTGKLKRAKGFTEKKVLLQKYATDVEKLPGGITSVLRSKTYGITPTSTSIMKAAGKEAGLLKSKNFRDLMLQKFKDAEIPCIKGVGGNCTSPEDFRKGFNQEVAKAAAGDEVAGNKMKKFLQGMRKVKGVAKWTGYGLLAEAGFMVPFGVADYATGKSWKRIFGNATDWGLGPMLGQSEQEEFLAALPEGSLGEEYKIAEAAGQRKIALENRPIKQPLMGMDRKAYYDKVNKFYTGVVEEQEKSLEPFTVQDTGDEPVFSTSKALQAEKDIAATQELIKAKEAQRVQERRERGFIAEKDWAKNFDYRGYREGGIASLKK